jgi:hypothetical protein
MQLKLHNNFLNLQILGVKCNEYICIILGLESARITRKIKRVKNEYY